MKNISEKQELAKFQFVVEIKAGQETIGFCWSETFVVL